MEKWGLEIRILEVYGITDPFLERWVVAVLLQHKIDVFAIQKQQTESFFVISKGRGVHCGYH